MTIILQDASLTQKYFHAKPFSWMEFILIHTTPRERQFPGCHSPPLSCENIFAPAVNPIAFPRIHDIVQPLPTPIHWDNANVLTW